MFSIKKILPITVLLLCTYCQVLAQTIEKSVLEKYNPSVIAKLFSIIKFVDINKDLQLQLAESIRLHDSTITNWLIIGKSKSSIDTLQQVAQFQLYGMLSKEQLQAYKYNSHIEISTAIADGEAEYLMREYKPDSLTFSELKRSLTKKYNYVLQNFSDNYLMNHRAALDNLDTLQGIYDFYKYFPVFYSKRYIEEFLVNITKIKNIPVKALAEIEHGFYNIIWQNKYSDWNLAAENATRIHFPDTAIFSSLHKKDIEQKVVEVTSTERYNLIFREHVTEDAFKKIEKFIKEKNYKNSVFQYTYATYYPQRFSSILKRNTELYDSIIKATMLYDGSLQPTTQFAIALKYKAQLKLRSTLCDTLVQHAMFLEKQRDSILFRDPFASIDFGEYETQYLSQLLTEDQYSILLFHKNRTYAAANAMTDWKEMVDRGLDKGFNREAAIHEMTEYYINKNAAWCRYANDKIRLWANLYALEQIKPKALKILDPVRWSGSTQKATNNLQLRW